jgi:spoIIIJ-associated protein
MSTSIEQRIKELLEELLTRMDLPFEGVDVEEYDGRVYRANINSAEASLLIGHNGEHLSALQFLMKSMLWRSGTIDENIVLIVDVDNYKRRFEDKILRQAEEKVDAVRMNTSRETLPPMSPYHRRLVHLHLQAPQFSDITTESIGEGENRRILIKLA